MDYNSLQTKSQQIYEAASNIQVMLKKRFDLLNRLIDLVKGYADHEKLIYLKISQDKNMSGAELADSIKNSRQTLAQITRIAEHYPQIKANQTYLQMIYDLKMIEGEMQYKREVFNQNVKNYNTKLTTIPTVLYAKPLGFSTASYLEFDNLEKLDQIKNFGSDDGERLQELIKGFGKKAVSATRAAGQSLTKAGKDMVEANHNISAKRYFYSDGEKTSETAVSLEMLDKLYREGKLTKESWVCEENGKEWIPYDQIRPRTTAENLPPLPPLSFKE